MPIIFSSHLRSHFRCGLIRDGSLFFGGGAVRNTTKKNCLQGLTRQNKLFAEKSGKTLKNTITEIIQNLKESNKLKHEYKN